MTAKAKAATMGSGIVKTESAVFPKKGEALPATIDLQTPSTETVEKAAEKNSSSYYKALTVKLDRERYEAIKSAGVKADKKSQEIFTEALDAWLLKNT